MFWAFKVIGRTPGRLREIGCGIDEDHWVSIQCPGDGVMERILYKLDFDASAQLVAIGIEEAMEKVRRGDVVPWRESDSIALTIRHKLRMNSQLFEDCEILVGGGDMRVTWLGKEIRFAKMESGEWKTAEIDGLLKAEAVQVEIVGDYLFARGEQEWARYAWRRPESPRGIDDVEKEFGMTLSAAHRRALLDPDDPLEEVLLPLNGEGSIFKVNEAMRRLEWKKWPGHIVAFATQGCGDYFAFDTSAFPYRIFYIDPHESVGGERGGLYRRRICFWKF